MKFGMNLTWHGFVEEIILEFLLQDHEHGHMQHGVPCVGGSRIPPWHQPKRYQQLLGQSMNGFLWRALPCRQILLCNAASWSNGSFGWDWGEIINYQLVIELLSCVGVRCVIVSFHWFFFLNSRLWFHFEKRLSWKFQCFITRGPAVVSVGSVWWRKNLQVACTTRDSRGHGVSGIWSFWKEKERVAKNHRWGHIFSWDPPKGRIYVSNKMNMNLICSQLILIEWYGGFLKWWYPTTRVFLLKMMILGCFRGTTHLRKPPYSTYRFLLLVTCIPSGKWWPVVRFGVLLGHRSLIPSRNNLCPRFPRIPKSENPNGPTKSALIWSPGLYQAPYCRAGTKQNNLRNLKMPWEWLLEDASKLWGWEIHWILKRKKIIFVFVVATSSGELPLELKKTVQEGPLLVLNGVTWGPSKWPKING